MKREEITEAVNRLDIATQSKYGYLTLDSAGNQLWKEGFPKKEREYFIFTK